ncbi:MAG: hypothetical protein R2762_21035 [Bryobacteraceae bacterium]
MWIEDNTVEREAAAVMGVRHRRQNRGLQATPLLYKGVLYLSADGSRVFAIDARTGARVS